MIFPSLSAHFWRLLPFAGLALACGLLSAGGQAQTSSSGSSSSSSTPGPHTEVESTIARPRAAQIEQGGSAVTLETSEPLFQMATALNACGYDADLDRSVPLRMEVRTAVNEALAASEPARASRDAVCAYITQHQLADKGLDIGQYVSLSLYLSPPPELTPNVDETELPPQAAAVVNVLPLLRTFGEEANLHLLWLRHRPEYEALVARVHDPMTRMILDTNIYLHQPVSSYDGRRFLVLLEPMLSPALTNARIYGSDYIIVTSPDNSAGDPVRLDQIRHIYLHYVTEPMVYSRGQAMERIQPLLRGVQDAPLEFFYKSDVVALINECLIKAIEARTLTIAMPRPVKPKNIHERTDLDAYEAQKALYAREVASAEEQTVAEDERQGWVLTRYFFDGLGHMEREGDGLRDEIAPMIYTMDVDRERRNAESIVWAKNVPSDPLRPTVRRRTLDGMDLAEMDLMKGNPGAAADLAEKAMADPKGDHARAAYVLARVELMGDHPDTAEQGFQQTLGLSKDPRTTAWSHIYLGRLYDTRTPPERDKALTEYKAALATRDSRPDTKLAAENGLRKPFALPSREPLPAAAKANDADFDPTGKAEKDAYKPDPPQ